MSFKSKLFVWGFVAAAILLVAHPLVIRQATLEDRTVVVTGAERVITNDDSYYLVYTDQGTFRNSDDLLAWKFNSSDFHGEFLAGGTFEVETAGIRFAPFSWYPNILEMERVDAESTD